MSINIKNNDEIKIIISEIILILDVIFIYGYTWLSFMEKLVLFLFHKIIKFRFMRIIKRKDCDKNIQKLKFTFKRIIFIVNFLEKKITIPYEIYCELKILSEKNNELNNLFNIKARQPI